jgi:prophage regulatory protein
MSKSNSALAGGVTLPAEGLVRIEKIIRPHGAIPVCRTEWYSGIAKGIYPRPVKRGASSFWKVDDIRALLDKIYNGEFGPDFSQSSATMAARARRRCRSEPPPDKRAA